MCLKFNNTAKRKPLASLLPYDLPVSEVLCVEADLNLTNVSYHENGPEENSEHEAVILKMDVIYNEKARV